MEKPKTMQEVIEKLKNRSQAAEQEGLIEKQVYNCLKCKDTHFATYRVHKETGDRITGDEFFAMENWGEVHSQWTEYATQCDCFEKVRVKNLMKASEITEEFQKMGFQNFQREGKDQQIIDLYEAAIDYFKSFEDIRNNRQNSIALLGQPGTGKTHLLTAVSNNLLRKGISVMYFPFVEGMNDLKDDFSALEAKISRMKRVDVLFIDDLFKPTQGKPRATEWSIEQMYSVINYRYLNKKPILISSELTVDELIDVDDALGSRIFEMAEDFAVVVKGDKKLLNHRLRSLRNV